MSDRPDHDAPENPAQAGPVLPAPSVQVVEGPVADAGSLPYEVSGLLCEELLARLEGDGAPPCLVLGVRWVDALSPAQLAEVDQQLCAQRSALPDGARAGCSAFELEDLDVPRDPAPDLADALVRWPVPPRYAGVAVAGRWRPGGSLVAAVVMRSGRAVLCPPPDTLDDPATGIGMSLMGRDGWHDAVVEADELLVDAVLRSLGCATPEPPFPPSELVVRVWLAELVRSADAGEDVADERVTGSFPPPDLGGYAAMEEWGLWHSTVAASNASAAWFDVGSFARRTLSMLPSRDASLAQLRARGLGDVADRCRRMLLTERLWHVRRPRGEVPAPAPDDPCVCGAPLSWSVCHGSPLVSVASLDPVPAGLLDTLDPPDDGGANSPGVGS